jgi:hypothetical protein
MAGTIVVNKKTLDRLREAFKRYGRDVLGDPDITVDFFATEYEGSVGVLLTSSRFQKMLYSFRFICIVSLRAFLSEAIP